MQAGEARYPRLNLGPAGHRKRRCRLAAQLILSKHRLNEIQTVPPPSKIRTKQLLFDGSAGPMAAQVARLSPSKAGGEEG